MCVETDGKLRHGRREVRGRKKGRERFDQPEA